MGCHLDREDDTGVSPGEGKMFLTSLVTDRKDWIHPHRWNAPRLHAFPRDLTRLAERWIPDKSKSI
jgi:hypothetical protein